MMFDFTLINRETIVPAMLPKGRLNPYAFACILSEIVDRGITPPSPEALQVLVEVDRRFVARMNRLYPDEPGTAQPLGLDTMERDDAMALVAHAFVGRDWPTFGEGGETSRRFRASLHAALTTRGWTPGFEPVA